MRKVKTVPSCGAGWPSKKEEDSAIPSVSKPIARPGGAGHLRHFGGSRNDDFNAMLLSQVAASIWYLDSEEDQRKQQHSMLVALSGIAPRDEAEGMLAAQMVALHNAAMEAIRRAQLPTQSPEARDLNLTHAGKLTQSYAVLMETLARRRSIDPTTPRQNDASREPPPLVTARQDAAE